MLSPLGFGLGSMAVIKHLDQRAVWGREDLFQSAIFRSHSISEGSQVEKWKQQHKAWIRKQTPTQRPCRKSACWPAKPAFLYSPGPCAQQTVIHSGLGPSISNMNQENVLLTCLQAIWWRHFCQSKFHFPSMSRPVPSWQKNYQHSF